MSKTREIISQVGTYSSAIIITQGIGVLAALVSRFFLGPTQTGIWSFAQIILTYSDYVTLGVTYAIIREIPFRRGKGEFDKSEAIKNNIFNFSFLMTLVLGAGIAITAFLCRARLSQEVFYGLLFTAFLVVLQQLSNVMISLLRAYKEFGLAGRQMVLSAILNFFLVALLSRMFKIYGFMWAMILSVLFNIFYLLKNYRFRFAWRFDPKEISSLIHYGFPLMTLTFFSTLFLTMDKLFIGKFLGLEALGVYSVATMAQGFIYSFPNAVGVVMIPNVSEKFGEQDKVSDLKSYIEKSNEVFSGLMPVLIGFAWFIAPFFIDLVIPKFSGGISALKILSLSAFFLALSQSYNNFLLVTKKHWAQFPIIALSCLAGAILSFLAVKSGHGIRGVAVAMTITLFGNFFILHCVVSAYIFKKKEAVFCFLRVIFKFVSMTGLLFLVQRYIGAQSRIMDVSFKCAAWVLICAAPIYHINSKFEVFLALKKKWKP